MIKAWSFEFNAIQGRTFPDFHDAALVQHTFDRNLERLAGLEALGFEGVFFSEHHFLDALSPNPNLLVAALAKMTTTLRLGVMGNVLPFHQPFRLAEDVAMLDYLTGGRLEIGVASGVPPEFLFANIAPSDVRPMYAEVLDILDLAARQHRVTYHGRFFDYDDVPIMPRLRPETARRRWVTIYSAGTCEAAAERGDKVCTGFQSVAAAARAFDAFRARCAAIGRAHSPDDVALRRSVVLADSDAQAADLQAELGAASMERMRRTFAPVEERLAKAQAGASAAVLGSGVMDAAAVPSDVSDNTKRADPKDLIDMASEFIFGSPATVAEQIIEQCRATGAGHLLAYHANTMTEAELDHHYALWAEVVPRLAQATVLQPA